MVFETVSKIIICGSLMYTIYIVQTKVKVSKWNFNLLIIDVDQQFSTWGTWGAPGGPKNVKFYSWTLSTYLDGIHLVSPRQLGLIIYHADSQMELPTENPVNPR
jgi:hypothetical protein